MRRYLAPFPGPRSMLALHGMCHFDVFLYQKLHDGQTVRSVLEENGHGAAAAELRRLKVGVRKLPRSLVATIEALAPRVLARRFRLAISGDREAQAWWDSRGQWELALECRRQRGQNTPYHLVFMEAAEQEAKALIPMLRDGDYPNLAAALSRLPIHSQLLSAEAIDEIRQSRNVLMIRFGMALELNLAVIAARDATLHAKPMYTDLLPSRHQLPSQRLFGWLKRAAGGASIDILCDMQSQARESRFEIDSLKDWSRGLNQAPSLETLECVVSDWLARQRDAEAFWSRYAVVRLLHLLGYWEQVIVDKLSETGINIASSEFDFYMHGFGTFAELAASRYSHWFDYHKLRTADASVARAA